MFYVLCSMFYVLCFMFYVLCFMSCHGIFHVMSYDMSCYGICHVMSYGMSCHGIGYWTPPKIHNKWPILWRVEYAQTTSLSIQHFMLLHPIHCDTILDTLLKYIINGQFSRVEYGQTTSLSIRHFTLLHSPTTLSMFTDLVVTPKLGVSKKT